VVITPHPGEMARLAGTSTKDVQARREPLAREFAAKHSVTVVLKGWRTLIAHPDGRVAINTTGNPGMAKGGSGDILTGIVAALLAQHPQQPAEAIEAAVYLHGLAADFAVREQDEHTLLATDTIGHLFRAFHFRPQDRAGYVWIEGIPSSAVRSKWRKRQT
jgi:ADP-dependent NAD(P)H-hydrate dehydratase / NAD(P)H-hydrate epimerase